MNKNNKIIELRNLCLMRNRTKAQEEDYRILSSSFEKSYGHKWFVTVPKAPHVGAKKVCKIIEGQIVHVFNSVADCARSIGFSEVTVRKLLKTGEKKDNFTLEFF